MGADGGGGEMEGEEGVKVHRLIRKKTVKKFLLKYNSIEPVKKYI
jgi:hypothetical protein